MEQNKAIQILVTAVQLATTKGAFTLQEAKLIAEATEVFMTKEETPVEEEVKKKK